MSKSKESVSYLRNALKSSCLRCCRGHLLEQLIQREERIAGGSRHGLPESHLPGQGPVRRGPIRPCPGSWWTGDWSSAGLAWWGRTRPPGMESYQQVWDQLQLVEQLGLSIFFWKLTKRILHNSKQCSHQDNPISARESSDSCQSLMNDLAAV